MSYLKLNILQCLSAETNDNLRHCVTTNFRIQKTAFSCISLWAHDSMPKNCNMKRQCEELSLPSTMHVRRETASEARSSSLVMRWCQGLSPGAGGFNQPSIPVQRVSKMRSCYYTMCHYCRRLRSNGLKTSFWIEVCRWHVTLCDPICILEPSALRQCDKSA